MIFFWVVAMIFSLLIVLTIIGIFKEEDDLVFTTLIPAVFMFFIFGLWGAIATYNLYDSANEVIYSAEPLAELSEQRAELIDILRDNLSVDDFETVMNASIPEDVQFLATRPEVANYILGKAEMLVSINAEYFEMRSDILRTARDVCKMKNNPLYFQFPNGVDCNMNAATEALLEEPAIG